MKKTLFLLAFVFSIGQIMAQNGSAWVKRDLSSVSKMARVNEHENTIGEQYFSLDATTFKQALTNAKDKFSNLPGVLVQFPNLNGEVEQFKVWENSNMTPDFQAKFPEIRAYVGQSTVDGSIINFSVSPQEVETILFRTNGTTEFIEAYDKNATAYVLFGDNNRNHRTLNCGTKNNPLSINDLPLNDNKVNSSAATYKTMRLALSCTAEYSNVFGANSAAQIALVLAKMNATMTRVNGVYEKDLAVHLNMIDNTNVIYYTPSSDPYSAAASMSNWNAELMNVLHVANFNAAGTGDAAFDIGHLFGATGGGGNAGCIGCVCSNDMTLDTSNSPTNYKGSGITSPGSGTPSGDSFDIDYVAHEMGHQLGANHTFTFQIEGTSAQTEPGSGSTIMGYAGITNNWYSDNFGYDIQTHSDPIFSYKSILQIQTNLNTLTCPVSTTMTDAVPVVSVGANSTIPIGTAFMLTPVSVTDADATDVLTYIWEENDVNTGADTSVTGTSSYVLSSKTLGANWRTFKPSANKFRYFPQMGKILSGTLAVATAVTSGTPTEWESVSSVARTLKFTFTARDNHPGGGKTATNTTNRVITVNATGGAFSVSSQAITGISYQAGTTQTVTWVPGSTASAPFNAPTVDILMTTNASTALETFNATTPTTPNPTTWTTIASAVPNNGSYVVTIPATTAASTTCRFMVKAVGNVFLAVNSKNFAITAASTASTASFGLDNFSIFPNPNNGVFSVKFNSSSTNDIKINVADMRGRQVYTKTYQNNGMFDETLQLSNLQAGVYLVSVQDGDRKETKKIIVQ